jgi:hypothetical protein
VQKILIFEWILLLEIQLQKLGLEGKISGNLNVVTLGPTTQATLVADD